MAGKSLTPFYVTLVVLAVAGGVFILRQTSGSRLPPLTAETTMPIAPGPRGVAVGPDSAILEVMEFSDFECPWCGQYARIQMPDVRQRLLSTGKVKWRFMHFPLSMHQKGPYAHLAAACADEQGKFWEMHDAIYDHQEEWSTAGDPVRLFGQYASQIGLDQARYSSCMTERRAWGRVVADKALGDSLAPNMGTPTFFLNGRQWTGARSPTADDMLALLDTLSRRAAPAGRPAAR